MKTQTDIEEILARGFIQDELEHERALIADRKLRVLSKKDSSFKEVRAKLRDLIFAYEQKNWSSESHISEQKLKESDEAAKIAENERIFIQRRKELIKSKLKTYNLNQQELGQILGHPSKSYMSELMNGLNPFTLRDLVIIHHLLKIDLDELIPTFIQQSEKEKVNANILELKKSNFNLEFNDLSII